jgi:hypothetical protein
MTKLLDVKIRRSAEQVQRDGQYTIKSVSAPENTRYGSALRLTVTNDEDEERTLFVPYANEVSDQSNLGRLTQAFGKDIDSWPKCKIDVTIASDGRRAIKPVAKQKRSTRDIA